MSGFTVERTVGMAVNLSKGVLPTADLASRMAIVRKNIAPQIGIRFTQLTCFRETKFALDRLSPSTTALNTPVAWGLTNVPAQSMIYSLAISGTYKHYNMPVPPTGGVGEFVRMKLMPGLCWTFLRESFATGGGMVLAPHIKAKLDEATGNALPFWLSKFVSGFMAGCTGALATMLPHNAALTAARMAQQGENPTTLSCLQTCLREQGLARALWLNFPQRCVVVATYTACLNTANAAGNPELSLAYMMKA